MSHDDTCKEPGGKKESKKKGTTALQAFVAFLELLLIAMETRHRYQKSMAGWRGLALDF